MLRDEKGRVKKGNIPHNYKKNITPFGQICASCKEEKELSAFGKDKSRVNGLNCYCKDCCKMKWEAIKDRYKGYSKAYYIKNKEKCLKNGKAYYEKNKEKSLAQCKKYYEKNKDKIAAINKKWVVSHKEQARAIKRKWKKENPGKAHFYVALRRMRIKNQVPKGVDLAAIRIFYINCPRGMEVDHIIPVSKGGLHCIENLQYLTPTENRSKGNKLLAKPRRE